MIKEIKINSNIVQYDLQHKNVKNINLRIKPDGSIYVSARKRVPQSVIDDFVMSKSDFINRAISKMLEECPVLHKHYESAEAEHFLLFKIKPEKIEIK